ncbi:MULTISPECIES: nucleoside triphosphate pyrophosphatase [unclassified Oceanispirochaeta]|uniref:nucleoside triphosphate pyrophosphatase n=1 Tax=unclassified Oceanispirochaeta TaxID=2635722 RepID=UPI000E09DC76|nr:MULTISPECIES: Maf family protein [unclassified Oceanispirochaeta]MBF9017201.1 septum formation protein Maf [Oceanispirochaeta sp. M2]NPD73650.1 septum formation protein Maf [Oceanispirochaeta sp. M1]RDG30580.1 septum formation protein Maf [Oceanispirochaeta sp. M1]
MIEKIYLASASPRRKQLVKQMGMECKVIEVDVEEPMDQKLHAVELAKNLSELKMNACLEHPELYPDDAVILTADTLIALDDEKIGKAETREAAAEMLRGIQGRSHQVITAFTIYSVSQRKMITDYESSDVSFSPMSEEEINNYLDTDEWKGVAGAYRIQEQGGKYISSLNGTFYNVMGLPINRIYGILSRL